MIRNVAKQIETRIDRLVPKLALTDHKTIINGLQNAWRCKNAPRFLARLIQFTGLISGKRGFDLHYGEGAIRQNLDILKRIMSEDPANRIDSISLLGDDVKYFLEKRDNGSWLLRSGDYHCKKIISTSGISAEYVARGDISIRLPKINDSFAGRLEGLKFVDSLSGSSRLERTVNVRSILIVEDNEDFRYDFSRQKNGVTVLGIKLELIDERFFMSGKTAEDIAAYIIKEGFDCVIMDNELPSGIHGLDVIKILREKKYKGYIVANSSGDNNALLVAGADLSGGRKSSFITDFFNINP